MPDPTYLPDPPPTPQDEYGAEGVVAIMNRAGDLRVGQRLAPVMNLAREFQIKEAGLNPYRTIILTSSGGWPSTGGGAATPTKVNFGNGEDIFMIDFDSTSAEYAQWTVYMPRNYDGSPLKARFVWTANSTSTNSVVWTAQGIAYGDGDTIDAAFGSTSQVTDANTATAHQIHISNFTGEFKLAGHPGPGSLVQLRVGRLPTDSADTLAVDARLISVSLLYRIKKYGD